jgi:hypothetical protein
MGGQNRNGNHGKQTDTASTTTASRITVERQEEVVTAFIRAYLSGRDRWIKLTLVIYGFLIFVLMIWFTIISGQLIEWKNYKTRANKILDNSEKALEDWKRATGITDSTETNNGLRQKE